MELLGSIIFIISGCYFIYKIKNEMTELVEFKNLSNKTKGIVTNIIIERDTVDSSLVTCQVYVKYIVEDRIIESYDYMGYCGLEIGDEISVYYNANRVRDIRFHLEKSYDFNPYLFAGYFILFLGLANLLKIIILRV